MCHKRSKRKIKDKNSLNALVFGADLKELRLYESFYRDFLAIKNALYSQVCQDNPTYDEAVLYQKLQKLLLRSLICIFAEQRGIIKPRNGEFAHHNKDHDLVELFEGISLFEADNILDAIKINIPSLRNCEQQLRTYIDKGDLSLSALAYIFEESLSEYGDFNAKTRVNTAVKQQMSARKREGVFYTPPYITRYLVNSSVGRLCDAKRAELGFNQLEQKLTSARYNSSPHKQESDIACLEKYKLYLLDLKILDPSCGSAAFLCEALSFLRNEHKRIATLSNIIRKTEGRSDDISTSILENNIFGVDVSAVAIELAKLCLWLSVAKPNQRLKDIHFKLRCGDSLIEDPAKTTNAFRWEGEFPEVFARGGFDVVLGNPPYVQLQSRSAYSAILQHCAYETYYKSSDLYCLFVERGYQLLRQGGYLAYILPNKWLIVDYGEALRRILRRCDIVEILNFGNLQFFSAATVNVSSLVFIKAPQTTTLRVLSANFQNIAEVFDHCVRDQSYVPASEFLERKQWAIVDIADKAVIDVMAKMPLRLKELPIEIRYGIKTGYNKAYYIDRACKEQLVAADARSADLIVAMLRGRHIKAWYTQNIDYLLLVHNGIKHAGQNPIDIEQYPAIKAHLDQYYDSLQNREAQGDTPYNLRSCSYISQFQKPKIIYPNMSKALPFMYDQDGMYINDKAFFMSAKSDAFSLYGLLALLNSSFCKCWIRYHCPDLLGGTREIRKVYFEQLPLPNLLSPELKEGYADLCVLGKKRVESEKRLYCSQKLSSSEKRRITAENAFLESLIEEQVTQLYNTKFE
ncbi:MAG: Eco57I restriction-modification methylase domain-containing protein [Bradymonadia bacterium]|jgi:hypothetical protein